MSDWSKVKDEKRLGAMHNSQARRAVRRGGLIQSTSRAFAVLTDLTEQLTVNCEWQIAEPLTANRKL
jgi:hypothetical protein